jgi:hypothetical protein
MPIPPPLLDTGWLAASILQSSVSSSGRAAGSTAALAAAVAGVVAVAAQRALAAGDLPRLRALIERALDSVEPAAQAEAGDAKELPAIADAEPRVERRRLAVLMRRQRA